MPPAGSRSGSPIRLRRAPGSGARPSRAGRRRAGRVRSRARPAWRKSETSPVASAVLKKGSMKTRWRVSGDADWLKRAGASRSTGTRTTQPAKNRRRPREPPPAEHRKSDDRDENRPKAGGRVTCDIGEVAEERQALAALADVRFESSCEHAVGEPERGRRERDERHRNERSRRPRARENEYSLRREDEGPVGMACNRRQHGEPPERPSSAPAALDRDEESEVGERAREEEQAVHAPVDTVEEHEPAGRGKRHRDQPDLPARESR